MFLYDKMRALGKPVHLYLPVHSGTSGAVACTCIGETTRQSDRPCYTCYGAQYAPGFLRFGHQTLFWASAEASGWTLSNCSLDTRIQPHRILLDSNALTGTITTTVKAFTNPKNADWEYQIDSFLRGTGNTVTGTFSTDGGTNWYALADINGANKPGVDGGNIQLRVEMTRTAAGDKSPAFEIARIRRAMSENANTLLTDTRSDYSAGQILVLRTWVMEKAGLDAARGRQIDHVSDRGWTLPLDIFDTSITTDTPAVLIDDSTPGPHPWYMRTTGVQQGNRYALTQVSLSEQLGIMTHQTFSDRRAQSGEVYHLVF